MGGRARRSEPGAEERSLRFAWWNLADFAHFDEGRAGEVRWPTRAEAYQEKCARVDHVFREIAGQGPLDVVALAEVTRKAACDLRDRVFPGFAVHSLDDGQSQSRLQVALIYDPKVADGPGALTVPNMPRTTRPMARVDVRWPGHQLRLYACHWTARFGEQEGQPRREDLAKSLSDAVHDFLHEGANERRHVLIAGDLNEEPFAPLFEQRLHGARDRASSRRPGHYTDKDVKRVRLYNAAWRLLGERHPHTPGSPGTDTAGTHYWQEQRRWATFDHVLVDGSLLARDPPFLVETELEVVSAPSLFGPGGLPSKFRWKDGAFVGLSDHLPIRGRILLTRENTDE